ncbi:hypothetical protein TNCV_1698241 [Trichonephila clavipes]|nr:hypothetical protein TNCV_1698241 [Trichonephila clavipes]
MPSPVQSNCDAHDTIANSGSNGAVWSMGHTMPPGLRCGGSPPPFKRLANSFSGDLCFPRGSKKPICQRRAVLRPPFLLIQDDISVFLQASYLIHDLPRAVYYRHFQ